MDINMFALHNIYQQLEKLKEIADDIYYKTIACAACKQHRAQFAAVERVMRTFKAQFIEKKNDDAAVGALCARLETYVGALVQKPAFKCVVSKCKVRGQIAKAHVILGALDGMIGEKRLGVISAENARALLRIAKMIRLS